MSRTGPYTGQYVRVEVTVAACVIDEDDMVLNDVIVDATIGLGHASAKASYPPTDEQIGAALTSQMSTVLATIQTSLMLSLDYAVIGQVEEPLIEAKGEAFSVGRTRPMTVTVREVPDVPVGRPS